LAVSFIEKKLNENGFKVAHLENNFNRDLADNFSGKITVTIGESLSK